MDRKLMISFGDLPHNLSIRNLLDIAIISLMIYTLLVWFKERASRFVLMGISLLGLLYVGARFFQLYLTTVVLQGFFTILLFVLVVIFQEDLRRLFERIAIWGRIGGKGPEQGPQHDIVEIIAHTVSNLARMRVGALIVLQGEEPLDRHIQGGTLLEGIVSQPLLESIFDPHSIGHDGAVIIDDRRVVRFGCHLPLSDKASQLYGVGLRHTAALGLAERSDALCIVVSEETGAISIAKGETLNRMMNPSDFWVALESFYAKKSPVKRQSAALRWIRENTKEKVIALLLAGVLWVVFGYQRESVRREFIVPIEYAKASPQWVIEEPRITEAKIMLMGPSQAFQLLDESTLKVSLDLSSLKEGRQDFVLSRDMVKAPSTLTVVSIKPARASIVASRLMNVSSPVSIVTVNEPPPGLAVEEISASPATVEYLIPSRYAHGVLTVRTEPINLSALTSTQTLYPKLIFPPEAQFRQNREPFVKVSVTLKKKGGQRN